MSRTITGTLKLPDGTAMASAKIKFTAWASTAGAAHLVQGAEVEIDCDASGGYSVTLENGEYQVQITYKKNTWLLRTRAVIATAASTDLGAVLQ